MMVESLRAMKDSSYLISCDWGTSAFRLRLIKGKESPKILADRASARGILSFPSREPEEFQSYLTLELDRLFRGAKLSPEPLPVYLSGMITSNLGWRELPYADLPFPLDGTRAVVERMPLQRVYGTHELAFISGVRSGDDVLRGEETELIGIIREARGVKGKGPGIVILPGTHSKVLEIQGNALVGFRTYLTGELYDILREQSILKHSVAPEPNPEEGALEFFDQGVLQVSGGGLLESLFSVRTNVLLKKTPRDLNTHYLSGLIIGAEAASVLKRFPPPRPILLGGKSSLQNLYRRAFAVLGGSARVHAVPEELTTIAVSLGHWRLRPVLEDDASGASLLRHGKADA